MASEQIQARLSKANYTLADIDAKASELGMNRTDFVLTAVEMLIGFNSDFYKQIQQYGKVYSMPVWQVIQNMITKRFAQESAEEKVWRGRLLRSYPEFSLPQGISYKDFFGMLEDMFIETENQKKDKKMYQRIALKQSTGKGLDKEEQAFLEILKSSNLINEIDLNEPITVEEFIKSIDEQED